MKPDPQNQSTTERTDTGEVVYRRSDFSGPTGQRPMSEMIQARAHGIAPAITPLIIGFTLLLGLILLQSYLSIHRADDVTFRVLDLENQYAARLSLLLKLRLAVTKLNNEARTRHEASARNELKPPFGVRLGTARDDVKWWLQQLERPPLPEDPSWRRFRNDLQSYVETTEDSRRYASEGFEKFRTLDNDIDNLLGVSSQEQENIFQEARAIEQEAARSIRLWSFIALLVGGIVATGTIWEVQRRFRQMRRSMDEARRERTFTTQLLEGMVSAVAAIDKEDRIRSANAAFFKIFPGASIGASVLEKFADDDAMKMLEAATASRVQEASYKGRWRCLLEAAEEQSFDVYSSPLAIDDAQGQVITLVDATQAAESERVSRRTESLAAVGQATAQVAHEIRNPLGSIRLGVSMLRDSVRDKEGLKTIDLVERGIRHLNKLILDVTQFSRQKSLEQTNVDLHELIKRSLELVTDKIKDKETPIEERLAGQKPIGHWDPDQLSQVFVNVIANAIDASPKRVPVAISTAVVNIAE